MGTVDLGLVKKVLHFDPGPVPGVGAPLILTWLALEAGAAFLDLQERLKVSGVLFQAALIVISALVTLIAHYGGDFWDTQLFDPRYALEGKWRKRDERAWGGLLPPGKDLDRARMRAVRALRADPRWRKQVEPNGVGVHRAAKQVVEEAGQSSQMTALLAWSKTFRSLIWPALITCLACGIAAAGAAALNWPGNPGILAVCAVLALVFAWSLLIPYFGLRVQYMLELYDKAEALQATKRELD